MSQTAVSTGKSRTLRKSIFISIILIALTWGTIIYWWQATQRNVTGWNIALWLGVLPCVLLPAMLILKRRKVRVQDALARQAMPENLMTQPSLPNVQPAPALPILNAWAVAHAAMDAGTLTRMLAERRTRPRPDPELTDDDGFPVLTSRVAGLDTVGVERWLARADAACHLSAPSGWRAAFVRTLALLELLIGQIERDSDALAAATVRNSIGQDESGATLRGTPDTSGHIKQFRILVRLMIPDAFSPHEWQLALDYLTQRLPLSPDGNLQVELVTEQDDASAIAELERFSLKSRDERDPQALLLLACDSMLCPDVLANWQSNASLFGTSCPNGLMAGEGAFGILCANAAGLDALSVPAACLLAGASSSMRDHSADAPGKPSHTALDLAAHDALARSGLAPDQVGMVVCDTDHRPSRILECIGTMARHTPHLDAIQSRFAVSESCGHLGAASGLATLAAGVQHVTDTSSPVLVLNLDHAVNRTAAVLVPSVETGRHQINATAV
ncbi:hypothetical protein [Noviherbaspirillum autotrophicum]|uniref:Uncharacterized protein n=1 Tax=Noviherbaspirillum autotrophicum TaxID=709839 RepID=A0A0C2BJR1_9BURK|nr:hypothetical protein [Noviherbaspirillum autotrophicum]KIF81430.1 hypothetical protein TSA66_12415 [Noviherbaspirillum autotrophicum]